MDIQEMHQYFRVYGQQVGMQNIRAILPEEIDAFLNVAINEKIREVLITNTTSNNTGLNINAEIGNLNFFRTLTLTKNLQLEKVIESDEKFKYLGTIDFSNIMFVTSICISYDGFNTYNCRIIDINSIHNVLNDYCNSPSKEYPACSITTNTNNNKNVVAIYPENIEIKDSSITIIKNPNVVSLDDNVSCDLPEYIHYEIVQLAVQTYFNSVGSTTQKVE